MKNLWVFMKIGIFFHGPKIFDKGLARELIQSSKSLGETEALINGPMGSTACFDTFLDDIVCIEDLKSSSCLSKLARNNDLVIVATYSKNPDSGFAYCWHVINRSDIPQDVSLIQIEFSSGTFIPWHIYHNYNGKIIDEVIKELVAKFSLTIKEPPEFGRVLWHDGEKTFRKVLAVEPGDFVLINGLNMGRAISNDVIVVEKGGTIVEIKNISPKKESLEKLSKMHEIELDKIKIDTTKSLRDYEMYYHPRVSGQNDLNIITDRTGIGFLDHAGYDIYRIIKNCNGLVSIGDDTTSVVSDIAYRFNVPVIGIIDQDRDHLLNNVYVHEDSEVFIVKKDDDAGKIIFNELFNKNDVIDTPFDKVKEKIFDLLDRRGILIKRLPMKDVYTFIK